MRQRQKYSVAITQRDEELFRYLFINKVATNEQIAFDVFNKASKQVVHRRLDKLIKSGFLDANYLREKGNRLVYSLSKNSLKEFIGDKGEMKRRQRKSHSFYHDLALVDIQRKISACSMVKSYFSENALVSGLFDDNKIIKGIREMNPDAIVEIELQDERIFIPLEFEKSTKFSHRYDKLISRYYRNPHVQAVLFISKSNIIQKKVMQTERKLKHIGDSKIFHILESELTKSDQTIAFKNINQEVLSLN